jgi:predicted TIM-barrel fold metal-dependent hydrolase
MNNGVTLEHPEYDLLPSEYFRRQIFACFWFEQRNVLQSIEALGPQSILYETDFPHGTSMTPGPGSAAVAPDEYRRSVLSDLPEATQRQIFFENAAALYHLD